LRTSATRWSRKSFLIKPTTQKVSLFIQFRTWLNCQKFGRKVWGLTISEKPPSSTFSQHDNLNKNSYLTFDRTKLVLKSEKIWVAFSTKVNIFLQGFHMKRIQTFFTHIFFIIKVTRRQKELHFVAACCIFISPDRHRLWDSIIGTKSSLNSSTYPSISSRKSCQLVEKHRLIHTVVRRLIIKISNT
jgi:hypothetical protein